MLLAAWVIAVMAVVAGSLAPALLLRKLPPVAIPDNDKAAHFLAYLLLAMLPVVAADLRMGLLLALAMIPLGVALEFFQQLVPTRSFELADMAANTLGVLTGMLIAIWLRGFRRIAAQPE